MKVILDRILVKKTEAPNKIGSILLSDTAQGMNYNEGVIVSTGGGAYSAGTFVDTEVYEDDKIAWLKGQGVEVKVDGEDFTIIRESDILFIR